MSRTNSFQSIRPYVLYITIFSFSRFIFHVIDENDAEGVFDRSFTYYLVFEVFILIENSSSDFEYRDIGKMCCAVRCSKEWNVTYDTEFSDNCKNSLDK